MASFFGEVGLFEDALGGIDVWKVERGAGMAGVEDCGQADTGLEGLDEDAVHVVVDDVTGNSEVDGVDDFVVAVVFVAVEIGGLSSMTCTKLSSGLPYQGDMLTGIVEEQRVIRSGILDQPVHSTENVLFRRLAHWVLLIVGEKNHILSGVPKVRVEISRHVLDIVDTASKLTSLTEVVYANEKRFASTCAVGVLEAIPLRSTTAKTLHALGRRRRSIVVSGAVGICIHGRKTCTTLAQATTDESYISCLDVHYTWGLLLAAPEVAVVHSRNWVAEAAIVISMMEQNYEIKHGPADILHCTLEVVVEKEEGIHNQAVANLAEGMEDSLED